MKDIVFMDSVYGCSTSDCCLRDVRSQSELHTAEHQQGGREQQYMRNPTVWAERKPRSFSQACTQLSACILPKNEERKHYH